MLNDSKRDAYKNDRALSLLSIRPAEDYNSNTDPNEWWDNLKSAVSTEFWRLCWSDDYEEHLTRLIRQFGKNGPMVDMKLCLADSIFMAQDYEHSPQMFSGELRRKSPELEVIAARYKQIQSLVAKIQVEMFLENPDLLERYYNLNIWSGQFVSRSYNDWGSFVRKVVGLDEFLDEHESDPDYWWYARQFMLLAHATGRDDLLRNVGATRLSSRYETWDTWLWTNIWRHTTYWTRLFPHPDKPIWVERDSLLAEGRELLNKPALPFPDWDVKVIPPPETYFLSEFYDSSAFLFGYRMPLPENYTICEESADTVSHMSELPYLGKAVLEFPADDEIVYTSVTHCSLADNHFGDFVEVLFAGIADETDIMHYCRKNGWSITSAGAYTTQWIDIIGRHANSIDPNDFPIADTSKDYELFKDAVIPRGDC